MTRGGIGYAGAGRADSARARVAAGSGRCVRNRAGRRERCNAGLDARYAAMPGSIREARFYADVTERRSPERAHRVLRDGRVGGDDIQSMRDRLAYQHAVEGISVQCGQFRKLKRSLFFQYKGRDAVP